MKVVQCVLVFAVLSLPSVASTAQAPGAVPAAPAATTTPGVVPAGEMHRLMPPSVFFQGQTATTQLRNSAAVRFGSGGLVLAGLVDTGGYASSVRNRYQFYLLSDMAFEAGGKRLGAGAYGAGFLPEGGLLVMDLGGKELLRAPLTHDDAMARPRPLQMVPGGGAEEYRLYLGKDFVTVRAAR